MNSHIVIHCRETVQIILEKKLVKIIREKTLVFWLNNVVNNNYREVTKVWHRGAIINIVAQQKMASRWIQKYREVIKDGIALAPRVM
jgi:hypothetical protein